MATENNQVKKAPTGADELANAVQNLNLNDNNNAEGAQKKPRKRTHRKKEKKTDGGDAPQGATSAAEAEEGEIKAPIAPVEHDNTAKVFVGNLSFETTQQELEEIFGKAGKIANVNVITRGDRSLGYGFISFESDADADKAVEMLDKSEIASRQINVERAQDKDPNAPRGRSGRGRGRGRGRGGRGYSRGAHSRRGLNGGRSDEAARVDEDEPVLGEEGHAVTSGGEGEQNGDGSARRGRSGRGRGRRLSRTPRPPRENNGETSSTTIFVANLPFKVTDDDLASIFKDYNVQSAHVVTLRSGRSKGFGFVEVASEEEQQKVLSELKNVQVDGRELVIKVAMAYQTPPAHEEAAAEAQNGTEAQ
ncbi:hypothetical protein DFJ77DRAFT_464460 [Powellomyces hirtus]|nr:hypothetical protein DFJ77DRAFT_464460 [Powellomyces hirtus]